MGCLIHQHNLPLLNNDENDESVFLPTRSKLGGSRGSYRLWFGQATDCPEKNDAMRNICAATNNALPPFQR